MSLLGTRRWDALERLRSMAFLIGGALLVVNAALLLANLTAGTRPGALEQTFVGAGWTAAFVGLLGFYPSLANRSRWLARAGAVFAVVGVIAMGAMTVAMLGYVAGILSGDPQTASMYLLPAVFLGIVLGFGAFGLAALRTDVYGRSVGLLFLLLPVTFLFNIGTGIAGYNQVAKILGVVVVLVLTMLAIAYLLRTGGASADRRDTEAASDASTG